MTSNSIISNGKTESVTDPNYVQDEDQEDAEYAEAERDQDDIANYAQDDLYEVSDAEEEEVVAEDVTGSSDGGQKVHFSASVNRKIASDCTSDDEDEEYRVPSARKARKGGKPKQQVFQKDALSSIESSSGDEDVVCQYRGAIVRKKTIGQGGGKPKKPVFQKDNDKISSIDSSSDDDGAFARKSGQEGENGKPSVFQKVKVDISHRGYTRKHLSSSSSSSSAASREIVGTYNPALTAAKDKPIHGRRKGKGQVQEDKKANAISDDDVTRFDNMDLNDRRAMQNMMTKINERKENLTNVVSELDDAFTAGVGDQELEPVDEIKECLEKWPQIKKDLLQEAKLLEETKDKLIMMEKRFEKIQHEINYQMIQEDRAKIAFKKGIRQMLLHKKDHQSRKYMVACRIETKNAELFDLKLINELLENENMTKAQMEIGICEPKMEQSEKLLQEYSGIKVWFENDEGSTFKP